MKNIYMVSPYDYMVTAVTVTVSSKKYVFCFVFFPLFCIFVPIIAYYYEERTEDLSAFADARAGIVQVAL